MLRWQRRGHSLRDSWIVVFVAVMAALIREPVFFVFGVPALVLVSGREILIAIWHARRWRSPSSVVVTVAATFLIPVFSFVALRPPGDVYDERLGVSFSNFRTMNVIGQRVLPDPYLRTKLEAAGMPRTGAEDHTNLFAMDRDWRLYAIPGMREFTNDFPLGTYLLAELGRPTKLLRFESSWVDAFVFTQIKVYEDGSPSDGTVRTIV